MNFKLAKGNNYEKKLSCEIHSRGIPILISPQTLRVRGAGQVDLAYLDKSNNINVFELKSYGHKEMSKNQLMRLKKSLDFLAYLLNKNVKLTII